MWWCLWPGRWFSGTTSPAVARAAGGYGRYRPSLSCITPQRFLRYFRTYYHSHSHASPLIKKMVRIVKDDGANRTASWSLLSWSPRFVYETDKKNELINHNSIYWSLILKKKNYYSGPCIASHRSVGVLWSSVRTSMVCAWDESVSDSEEPNPIRI